jgi:copper chaperone CopZ
MSNVPSFALSHTAYSTPKPYSIMPTHSLLIVSPKMVCSGCTGTVEGTLKKCPGVTDVAVSLKSQTATVTTSDDSVACKCAKDSGGKCKCGADCQCMQRSLISALNSAGFNATTEEAVSVNKCSCMCGTTCACGPNCTCPKKMTLMLQKASIGVAVFAIGWMASKKYYSR